MRFKGTVFNLKHVVLYVECNVPEHFQGRGYGKTQFKKFRVFLKSV